MFLTPFAKLPQIMQNDVVRQYYLILEDRKTAIIIKRIIDIVLSVILLFFLCPLMIIISALIYFFDGKNIIFKQKRITKNYKIFYIYKFRTMKNTANSNSYVTVKDDDRITKIGKYLRKTRLDELPQLINVVKGEMSFVGTRPEVQKYVDLYSNEMLATLLLPAGITSIASIKFKNEAELLSQGEPEQIYINNILPEKMKMNLSYLTNFSIIKDFVVMLRTII